MGKEVLNIREKNSKTTARVVSPKLVIKVSKGYRIHRYQNPLTDSRVTNKGMFSFRNYQADQGLFL